MAEISATSALRPWHRFHVRVSLMYGGLILAVLLAMSWVFYVRAVDRELTALQARLRIAAMTLAAATDPSDLAAIHGPADADGAAFQRLEARFRAVAAAEPEFSDLYVMRPSADPDALEVVVDVVIVADAEAARPGDRYPIGAARAMRAAFTGPTVEATPYRDAWGEVLSGYAPIRDGAGTAIAIVGVDVRATRLAAIKREAALVALAVLLAAIAALTILAAVVARSVRTPLARMVEATNAIAAGQLSVRAGLERTDEFGVVGRHFDQMASGLEEREFIKATFGQYVAPEVVARMLSDRSHAVHGQRRRVAVMFVDVRGFTTLAEGLEPEAVVALLNDYLDCMTAVITARGGRVDKFIGDAIMADWGALEEHPAAATAAVETGLAMLAALAEWNAARAARGAPGLAIGIAIHIGDVVAGSVGSAKKLEYTVIGDAVNVASRLEGLCKTFGARLVASGPVVAEAGAEARARWLDTLVLRGRAESTEVFELLTDDDPRQASLAAYRAATALVRADDPGAVAALRALGDDPAAAYHLARLADG